MAKVNPTTYFMGAGAIYVAERGASGQTGAWMALGDCPRFTVSASVSTSDVFESQSGKRTVGNSVVTGTDVSFELDARNFSKENLARMFQGAASVAAAIPIVDEPVNAFALNSPVFVSKPIGFSDVSVKSGATALVEGEDYIVVVDDALVADGSIQLISDENLTGDAPYTLSISYTPAATETVEVMTEKAKEYMVKFVGVNVADEEAEFVVDVHRATFNLPSTFDLINETQATFPITGKVLADGGKGAGQSRYIKIVKKA